MRLRLYSAGSKRSRAQLAGRPWYGRGERSAESVDQVNQYVENFGAFYEGSYRPYTGDILHDVTVVVLFGLLTLVVAFGGGLVVGPLMVWASSSSKRQSPPVRVANAVMVRFLMLIGMLYFTGFSVLELLLVHDFIVGLALIPAGLVVLGLLFRFVMATLPDWLNVGTLFTSVALLVSVGGYGVLRALTQYVPATGFIWNLVPPVVGVIIGGVLGALVALVVVLVDLGRL
jgi:hypothetical protein